MFFGIKNSENELLKPYKEVVFNLSEHEMDGQKKKN